MGTLRQGDGTMKTKEEEGGGHSEILAVPQAGEGTEITTPISSPDPFFFVVWKLLDMMTKFIGLGLGQNGLGEPQNF